MSFYAIYPTGGGSSGSGVSSLNGLTGALTLAAGSGIVITPSGSTLTISTVGSGIQSINGDTTAAQTLVTASTGTNFTISTTSGVTTFAIPTASSTARGLLASADWTTFDTVINRQLTYTYTLNSTDISNKYITLPQAPIAPLLTLLTVIGGPMQSYGGDYTVSGSQLGWGGLFLDGVLVSGDMMVVEYN